jgi:dipeptidyl aminopeptidase/acylaminoacyl peptidase
MRALLTLLIVVVFAIGALPLSTPAQAKQIVTPERLLADDTTTELRDFSWTWLSPRLLVFSIRDTRPGESGSRPYLKVADIETGEIKQLTEGWRPKPSPDGKKLCFLLESQSGLTQIMLLGLPQTEPKIIAQISSEVRTNIDVVWSPDSRMIAYWISNKAGTRLWLKSVDDDRDAVSVVELPASSDMLDLKWSPDSRMIAYTCRPKLDAPAGQEKSASVVVIGASEFIPPDAELWVLDLESRAKRKLNFGPYSIRNLEWNTAGTDLLFVVSGRPEYKNRFFYETTIKVVSMSDARMVNEFKSVGPGLGVSFSPDGNSIAFVHAADPIPNYDIIMAGVRTAAKRQLTASVVVLWSGLLWAPDGNGIYFRHMDGVLSQLGYVTTGGQFRQITRSSRNVHQLALSSDGRNIAWTTFDLQGGADLRVARADGSGERVLVDLKPQLKDLLLGQAQMIKWKSQDGLEISGLLTLPVGYRPEKKYPLIVDLHGGPTLAVGLRGQGAILVNHPLESQMWAGRGYAVLSSDYRTSGLYGREPIAQAREKQEFSERDFEDIMSGVDHVIEMGIADPDRLVVLGHSHGGYLTNWIITHTHRFKVAVSKEAYGRIYVSYSSGLEGAGSAPFAWLHKGPPWEVSDNYRKWNPAEYVKGVKTPTLFISGEAGYLDRYGNPTLSGVSFPYNGYLYTALKNQGVDSQLLLYRGEGHVITRPENKRDVLMRAIAWIESHLN